MESNLGLWSRHRWRVALPGTLARIGGKDLWLRAAGELAALHLTRLIYYTLLLTTRLVKVQPLLATNL